MQEILAKLTTSTISDWIGLLILGVGLLLDFACGVAKAWIAGTCKSHEMKVGGIKKTIEFVCYAAFVALANLIGIKSLQILLVPAIMAEAISIWENMKQIAEKKDDKHD